MSESSRPLPIRRPSAIDDNDPFADADDVFARKDLAERLTNHIDRLKDGCVIAIDAPWGEGKSWFGQRWAAQLKQQGHKVAFIDAFKHDHVEDPFVMVCAEILAILETSQSGKVKASGIKVLKALAPTAAKIGANMLGRFVLGTQDISEEISKAVADGAADAVEAGLKESFERYEASKASVEGFAKTLEEAASGEDKPIVVFIDELDRCRPDFAVRTIERIKHFFDVPKVIFVLLLNRQQLEAAVCGVYGEKTDASTYLGKFVHLFLQLPKAVNFGSRNYNTQYCNYISLKMGFPQTQEIKFFAQSFGGLATLMRFSLRHIERAYTLLAMNSNTWLRPNNYAWPIALKIGEPNLYVAIMRGDRDAHTKAADILDRFEGIREGSSTLNILIYCAEFHRAHANNDFRGLDKWDQLFRDNDIFSSEERDTLLPMWFRGVDLDID